VQGGNSSKIVIDMASGNRTDLQERKTAVVLLRRLGLTKKDRPIAKTLNGFNFAIEIIEKDGLPKAEKIVQKLLGVPVPATVKD